jgi:hypothetical protein
MWKGDLRRDCGLGGCCTLQFKRPLAVLVRVNYLDYCKIVGPTWRSFMLLARLSRQRGCTCTNLTATLFQCSSLSWHIDINALWRIYLMSLEVSQRYFRCIIRQWARQSIIFSFDDIYVVYTFLKLEIVTFKPPKTNHGRDKILCSVPRTFSGPRNIFVLVIDMDKTIRKLWLNQDRSDVEPLIRGYPNNEHKSFPTLDQAVNHLAEHGVPEDQRAVVTPTESQGQGEDSSPATAWNGARLERFFMLCIKRHDLQEILCWNGFLLDIPGLEMRLAGK